jgi:hypothetical protein
MIEPVLEVLPGQIPSGVGEDVIGRVTPRHAEQDLLERYQHKTVSTAGTVKSRHLGTALVRMTKRYTLHLVLFSDPSCELLSRTNDDDFQASVHSNGPRSTVHLFLRAQVRLPKAGLKEAEVKAVSTIRKDRGVMSP